MQSPVTRPSSSASQRALAQTQPARTGSPVLAQTQQSARAGSRRPSQALAQTEPAGSRTLTKSSQPAKGDTVIRRLEHFPAYSQTEKKKVVYPRYGDMHIVADTTGKHWVTQKGPGVAVSRIALSKLTDIAIKWRLDARAREAKTGTNLEAQRAAARAAHLQALGGEHEEHDVELPAAYSANRNVGDDAQYSAELGVAEEADGRGGKDEEEMPEEPAAPLSPLRRQKTEKLDERDRRDALSRRYID